jgi:Golgi phosphoprotein 3 (GPP34)
MHPDGRGVSLPEELLLICADPRSGVLSLPVGVSRLLGGAVLTELLLGGHIGVDKRHIVLVSAADFTPADGGRYGYRPPFASAGTVFTRRVLTDLATTFNGRQLNLQRWVNRASKGALNSHLAGLADRGLITSRRRRVLGPLSVTAHIAAHKDWASLATDRIRGALPDPVDRRTRHLAALIGALDQRILTFAEPGARDAWRSVRALTRDTPIADATRKQLSTGD